MRPYHRLTRNHPRRVDGLPGHRGIHRSGRRVGVAPRRMLRRGAQCCALSLIPEAVGSNRVGFFRFLGCVEDGDERCPSQFLAPGEEREEPMSSTPISDDEHPEADDEAVSDRIPYDPEGRVDEVDDETLSEVVRRPTRTAGDLAEVADASPGITTEDLARDLESVASKRGVPTESELLADLLRRVERIEQHLGITN
jgi:hypothetical protein